MKRYLPFVIIVLAAIATVTAGTLLYRAKLAELVPVAVDASAASAKSGAKPHVRGDAKAAVTLEEFGDFQCPPCGTLASVLTKIEHDYGSKLRVIFRQFPLAMHNHAAHAAGAAEAAGMQGKFWEMHDLLYRKQVAWSKESDVAPLFTEYAQALGLDLERFREDVASPELRERIEADRERGKSLGVTSTPTIFVNNNQLPPASLNEAGLRAAIDAALRGEKPPTPAPTATPPPATKIAVPSATPQP